MVMPAVDSKASRNYIDSSFSNAHLQKMLIGQSNDDFDIESLQDEVMVPRIFYKTSW
jgi:hypothetical protein